jgi:hypothetical protein
VEKKEVMQMMDFKYELEREVIEIEKRIEIIEQSQKIISILYEGDRSSLKFYEEKDYDFELIHLKNIHQSLIDTLKVINKKK